MIVVVAVDLVVRNSTNRQLGLMVQLVVQVVIVVGQMVTSLDFEQVVVLELVAVVVRNRKYLVVVVVAALGLVVVLVLVLVLVQRLAWHPSCTKPFQYTYVLRIGFFRCSLSHL